MLKNIFKGKKNKAEEQKATEASQMALTMALLAKNAEMINKIQKVLNA